MPLNLPKNPKAEDLAPILALIDARLAKLEEEMRRVRRRRERRRS